MMRVLFNIERWNASISMQNVGNNSVVKSMVSYVEQ